MHTLVETLLYLAHVEVVMGLLLAGVHLGEVSLRGDPSLGVQEVHSGLHIRFELVGKVQRVLGRTLSEWIEWEGPIRLQGVPTSQP